MLLATPGWYVSATAKSVPAVPSDGSITGVPMIPIGSMLRRWCSSLCVHLAEGNGWHDRGEAPELMPVGRIERVNAVVLRRDVDHAVQVQRLTINSAVGC